MFWVHDIGTLTLYLRSPIGGLAYRIPLNEPYRMPAPTEVSISPWSKPKVVLIMDVCSAIINNVKISITSTKTVGKMSPIAPVVDVTSEGELYLN